MVAKNPQKKSLRKQSFALLLYDPSKKRPLNVQVLINFDGHLIITTQKKFVI